VLSPLPVLVPYHPLRMSVGQYFDLLESGLLSDSDRCELLDGVVVEKMTKNPPHTTATWECNFQLTARVPPGWYVRNQDPIELKRSVPEPDLAIVRGANRDYASRHPVSSEIELVLEVADSSLPTDRYKASLYAAAGIPVYWIVNLADLCLETYADPDPDPAVGEYRSAKVYGEDESVRLTVDGVDCGEIRVKDLLP
jgi:Uma2 family endonuclease